MADKKQNNNRRNNRNNGDEDFSPRFRKVRKKNKKIKKFIKLGNQQHQKIKLSPSQYLKKVNSKMQLR